MGRVARSHDGRSWPMRECPHLIAEVSNPDQRRTGDRGHPARPTVDVVMAQVPVRCRRWDEMARIEDTHHGSAMRRATREILKILGAVGVVALAGILVVALWPDGFEGPVDEGRLAATGAALAVVRADVDSVSSVAGTTDHGTVLTVECRMGDSVPVGPSLRRVWTAVTEATLAVAREWVRENLIGAGWTAAGPSNNDLTRLRKSVDGLPLIAETETHDAPGQERDLTIFIHVGGPDGCTSWPQGRTSLDGTGPPRPANRR